MKHSLGCQNERDRGLIYAATFIRALATGMMGVLLALYLSKLGMEATLIGWVIGAGLLGATTATVAATLWSDSFGRRRFLIMISLLGAVGGLASALSSGLPAILAAAFIGMLNGMGKDRGAVTVIESAVLPSLQAETERTRAFAWLAVIQDAGHALGGVLAGAPSLIAYFTGGPELISFRTSVALYSVLIGTTAILYFFLSSAVEVPTKACRARVTNRSKRILLKISSLFAIDSLAGGFLTSALLAFFFYERFGISAASIGLLFFAARLLNALSHFGAAWLAKRIGLVNTMVFTHIPSSLLLATVVFAPSFSVAAILFLLREALVEMDVPTRQSYLMAMMNPEERTFASGITHIVRMGGWAVAPMFAGVLMDQASLGTPIFIGVAMKILYDFLLYLAFRHVRPPEEQSRVTPIVL